LGAAMITLLLAMVEPCYAQWITNFNNATQTYNANLQSCQEDHFVPFFSNSLSLCNWEADAIYDATIDADGAAYEACLRG